MALTAYQAHMKRELKGKMKGKTAAQRKAIFKAAAKSYKGGSKPKARASRAVTRVRTSISSKPKGGTSRMGKKNGFNTQKIFKYVRLGALALPAATQIMRADTVENKLYHIGRQYFAFNSQTGKFDASQLMNGYGPFLAATAITWGIPKLAGMIRGL